MNNPNQPLIDVETADPVFTLTTLLLLILSVGMGAFMAAVLLPAWLPGMADSLLGTAPKAFWYLSRGSALVAFVLLWFSMAIGVAISNKLARLWPGGPAAFELHEYASLLGMAFGIFHALILLGDQFIGYNLAQVLVPFGSINYKPFWVGLGQLGLYVWAIVNISFYVRHSTGTRTWRCDSLRQLRGVRLRLAARHLQRDGYHLGMGHAHVLVRCKQPAVPDRVPHPG